MDGERDAHSVAEFCKRHSLCRATFYNLMKAGKGPPVMKIGARTLISAEAAAAWRRQMEAQTAKAA